jgi:NADH dehydrogenase
MGASIENTTTPRVIVIGGGFGGLYACKELSHREVTVTLIDRTNHHLFQPLLYQVATAGLSPGDVAQPTRHILRRAKNIEVIMGEVAAIEPDNKAVVLVDGRKYSYDYLIVAAGARHSYFGHEDWESDAPGLKSLEDALELRRRILSTFELAESLTETEARAQALTFVIVGAGPTGVEMAGAISELARKTLAEDFRHIDVHKTRVVLLEGASRVLPSFPEDLSRSAQRQLEQLHVEVHTGVLVKNVTADGVLAEDHFIPARTVIWAAGNAAAPIGKSLGAPTDRMGRVIVEPDLSIPGHPEIFAIGDMAQYKHQGKQPLPGLSPVAMQMGRHAARNIMRLVARQRTAKFRYFDKGYMATIGRNKAVANLHLLHFGGFFAWAAWLFVHLIFLIGFENRISVLIQWAWAYFTFSRGSRLLYGRFQPRVVRDQSTESSEEGVARSE